MRGLLLAAALAVGLFPPGGVAAQEQEAERVPPGRVLVEFRFEKDYLRLEELSERLQADIVRFNPPNLYLVVDETLLPSLRQEGFRPRILEPADFFEEVVHVAPATDSIIASVVAMGGELLQREDAYAIFRVSLRELSQLRAGGLRVRRIQEGELVPRYVEIVTADEASVALVVAAGVDIFEARDTLIFGRAYDQQIQALARQGLQVRIVAGPPEPQR